MLPALDVYFLKGLGAIILWSTTVALVRSLSGRVGAIRAAAYVHCVGGIVAVATLALRHDLVLGIRSLPLTYVAVCGVLFIWYMFALYLAIGRAVTDEQTLEIGLLNYLWPLLILVLSVPILGSQPRLAFVPGAIIALVGIYLAMTAQTSTSLGAFMRNARSYPVVYGLALSAAVSWALYSNLTRRWAEGVALSGVILFIPITGLVLFALSRRTRENSAWTKRAVLETVVLGVITFLAYLLWDGAMQRGAITDISAVAYFTPVLSTFFMWRYLRPRVRWRIWAGAFLVFVGSLVSLWGIAESG